jgi:hypothetical protein
MAEKKLAATVHVHREDGTTVVYTPDDNVPAADAKLITHPRAWATSDSKPEK